MAGDGPFLWAILALIFIPTLLGTVALMLAYASGIVSLYLKAHPRARSGAQPP